MQAKRRIRRNQLKEPDQFLSRSAKAILFVEEHSQEVLYGTIAILLVLGLTLGFFVYQVQKEEQANFLFSQAREAHSRESRSSEKFVELARPYQELIQQYPGTKGAFLSQLYLGHLSFEAGEYEKAVEAYRTLVNHRGSDQLLESMARLGLGYALEAQGKCEEALPFFQAVTKDQETYGKEEAYLATGRCSEKKGDIETALKVYTETLEKFPRAVWGEAIREKVENLKRSVEKRK
ncbi:MAG: tetratricopeptide repeat protein [Candidatus Tectomicrobia bacterium]|nr:tetratricopeptide repeat protein [Candidatus Tectomicrobia bacterium]